MARDKSVFWRAALGLSRRIDAGETSPDKLFAIGNADPVVSSVLTRRRRLFRFYRRTLSAVVP